MASKERMSGNEAAVSYTHLDVYKRQVWRTDQKMGRTAGQRAKPPKRNP